jgi:septal ring factor EnvC (AmiA/AmiB activator)
MGAWLFVRSVFRALTGISLPLLLVMALVAAAAVPPTWKWATASRRLSQAQRAIASQGMELGRARRELAVCTASLNDTAGALEAQNAAVDRLRVERMAATRRANAAVATARNQARAFEAKIRRLEAVAPTADVCASARALIVQSLEEDRR